MKNKALTLAEVIIVLAVVGIIAAIFVPLANKFVPDKNKVLFLKVYDSIISATQDFATNQTLFPITNENDDIIYKNYPFVNNQEVEIDNVKYSGKEKYCKFLATTMNSGNPNCNVTPNSGKVSFVAQNGIAFWVDTLSSISDTTATYQTDVYFDVDGVENGNNCFYSTNCKNPDRFKLMISSDGKVVISDEKGQEYLLSRANFRKVDEENFQTLVANLDDIDRVKPLEKMVKTSSTRDFMTIENPEAFFYDAGGTGAMAVFHTNISSLEDFLELYKNYNVTQTDGPYPQKYWIATGYAEVVNGGKTPNEIENPMARISLGSYTDYTWYKMDNDPYLEQYNLVNDSGYKYKEVYRVWNGKVMQIVYCT